jgi:hypothetical protein
MLANFLLTTLLACLLAMFLACLVGVLPASLFTCLLAWYHIVCLLLLAILFACLNDCLLASALQSHFLADLSLVFLLASLLDF